MARIGGPDTRLSVNKIAIQSQSPPELVTNAWQDYFQTSITRVNWSNIFTLEIPHNNADWDYFKIHISLTENRIGEDLWDLVIEVLRFCRQYTPHTRIFPCILKCAYTLHGSRRLTSQPLCRAQKGLVSSPCVTNDVARVFIAHFSYTHEHIGLVILDCTLEFHLNNTCGSITRNEDYGSMAITDPMSSTCSRFLIIFGSYIQTSKARTSTKSTTWASTERRPVWHKLIARMKKSLLRGAQSVLASTGQPVVWQTKQKSSRELDNERTKAILQVQKELFFAEARSEILKHENKASLTEDYIRGLKGQFESIQKRTRSSSRRSSWSRTSSSRYSYQRNSWDGNIEEESWILCWWIFERKIDWTSKIPSTSSWPRCRNYNMRSSVCMIQEISRTLDQVHSEQLPHFPWESALLLPHADQGGLLSRAITMQPDIWDTHGTSENVLASSLAYSSTPCPRILNPWDDPTAGRIPVRANTGQSVVENGDRERHNPYSEISQKLVNWKFIHAQLEGRHFKNYGVDQ